MTIQYTERQRTEKLYHDQKFRQPLQTAPTGIPAPASRKFWESVGRPQNKVILDFGCGDGWLSVPLAQLGNRVHGFDISEVLIARAKQRAAASNVSENVSFAEMAAENLNYPAEHFDLIIGTSILHHTDLESALRRIWTVLKPSGTAVFLEPLNQNLALRLWRLLTPWRRSSTERALTRADLAVIRRLFPSTRFHYFCFTSMFTEGLRLAVPRSRAAATLNRSLEKLDETLLRTFPALGRFSAVVVLEVRR